MREFDQYKIVVNHEEQYYVLRSDQPVPTGFKTIGDTGTKTQCLTYIEEVWTDTRPPDWQTRVLRRL